jgi:hypothetical protein
MHKHVLWIILCPVIRQLPRSAFNPLVPDHEPVAIPEDCLHGVAAFVDEEEQFSARWETQHDETSLATLPHDVTATFFPGI